MKNELKQKDNTPGRKINTAKPEKQKKYWNINKNFYSRRAGLKFLNEELLTKIGGRLVFGPPAGKRGFLEYPEPPKIVIDKKLGRPPRDLELFGEYWLISAKTKNIFEALDPDAFAFCKCETRFPDGTEGPEYWLCDVLPMLDAVDEENSVMDIQIGRNGTKSYGFVGNFDIKLREDIIGERRIFRLKFAWSNVICDDSFKKSCKELANISFNKLKRG